MYDLGIYSGTQDRLGVGLGSVNNGTQPGNTRIDPWRAAGPIHGGSSVESGCEPRTLRLQSRDALPLGLRPYSSLASWVLFLLPRLGGVPLLT
ncbi:hypothetical protein AVEN_163377-1 [Araneus ventricosus]|uniref:Uncharacterized protein n=1 Tax=Araneus ventricosus TaxID=182803 RepID=A0A4Y2TD43_ARAVE|nr:hypothetical protein AVEN_163377-1 [Araneus ventricosus]